MSQPSSSSTNPHMSTTVQGLSIGEVATKTGIPIETLRFYDRSGLLGELPRTGGGHRVFDESSLGLLDVVIRLRRTGMPVEDVRAFVERVRADRDRAGRIELLRRHRDRVGAQLEQLTGDLAVIDWKIAAYSANEAGETAPEPPPGWPGAGPELPAPDDFVTASFPPETPPEGLR